MIQEPTTAANENGLGGGTKKTNKHTQKQKKKTQQQTKKTPHHFSATAFPEIVSQTITTCILTFKEKLQSN